MRTLVTMVCLMATAGCIPNSAQRTGTRYPALAAGCPVEFIENTSSADMGSYENLGSMTIAGADGFTDSAKKELQDQTCEWGGTAVSIMSSAASTGSKATTFTIHKKREVIPSDATLACNGTFLSSSGGTIEITAEGSAKFGFQGSAAECKAKPLGGEKLLLDCGQTLNQEGAFASDCSKLTVGGMDYAAKK